MAYCITSGRRNITSGGGGHRGCHGRVMVVVVGWSHRMFECWRRAQPFAYGLSPYVAPFVPLARFGHLSGLCGQSNASCIISWPPLTNGKHFRFRSVRITGKALLVHSARPPHRAPIVVVQRRDVLLLTQSGTVSGRSCSSHARQRRIQEEPA